MRRLLAVLVVSGLCTVGVGAAGASVRADDSAVTKDEIKIGVSYVDLAPVRAAGIKRDHGDYQKAFQTVIDDLNARGGINGRKIVPVYQGVNPIGTDPAQVACLKLTEDEKVFAVIGQFQTDAPLCYVEQHNTPIVGGTITSEYLARAKAPWYTLEQGDSDTALIIDAFAKDGVFKKGKLGIAFTAEEKPLFDKVVLPALKKNKASGTVAVASAPIGDVPAQEAEMDTILEKFEAEGVKTILASANEATLVAQRLAKTDYRPRIVATSSGPLASYYNSAGSDLTVMKDSISGVVGYPWDEPSIARCRGMVAAATGTTMVQFPPPGEPNPGISADTACRYVALFAALAGAAGKNLSTASFGKAAKKAGSVEVPGSGKIAYDPKTHSFAQDVFLTRFDPAQKRFVNDPEPTGQGGGAAR